MAEGNGNGNGGGWSTVKVFTVILAINAVLLPLAVSIVSGLTTKYDNRATAMEEKYDSKLDASARLYGDHEKRIVVLEERVLTKQEKQDLLSLLRDSNRRSARN